MNNGIGFIGMVERPFDKSDFVFENQNPSKTMSKNEIPD
jgi:hypothetical protein